MLQRTRLIAVQVVRGLRRGGMALWLSVMSLGLALAATSLSAQILDSLIFRMPGGIANPETVVKLFLLPEPPGHRTTQASLALFDGLRSAAGEFRVVAAYRRETRILGRGDASRQVDYLADDCFSAEFYLTQIVSHLNIGPVERFVMETRTRGLETLPGMFGIFYYRSANPKTLETLRSFLPVPVEGLTREFADGATPEEVCARSIRALADAGARAVYVSNLPVGRAQTTLANIMDRVNG